jgi:DNA-binding transcriptional LysR family regulator
LSSTPSLDIYGLARSELGGLWFSNYSNIVEAARDGHGIAIGWRHVVERHMESGELVNPTGKVFKTGRGFYLLKKQANVLAPAAQRLHDWVSREFKE